MKRQRVGVVLGVLVVAHLCRGADDLLPPDRSIEHAVDHYLGQALQAEGVRPAAQADDAAVLRRLTLDLVGRIPTPAEVRQHQADTAPDRRVRLVERLLASPAFVRHQAAELETLLTVNAPPTNKAKSGGLREYLRGAVADNRSWDRVFREIMLADDADPKTKGASEFLRSRVKDLDRLTSDVSSIFFGVNISCAQCHDHPLVADWKQDHYYGLKSFFARTVESGPYLAERDFGVVKYTPHKGKEKLAPVMFLTGTTVDVPGLKEPSRAEQQKDRERVEAGKKTKKAPAAPSFSVRAKLVELALAPGERAFFARALVNRVWHRLFGQGLVMPLDQMHSANPPSHPELLEWLARDFAEHGYDLRRLLRGLVLSQAYSRSSRWEGSEVPPPRLFAVAQIRPLTPTQLATSLILATADPEALPTQPSEVEKRLEEIEKNAAALAGLFAPPTENFQVGVGEALLFSNNGQLEQTLLADGSGRLVTRLAGLKEPAQQADLAVRTVLSRPPRPEELTTLTDYLRHRADRPAAACRHVVWALLAGAEFRFNH